MAEHVTHKSVFPAAVLLGFGLVATLDRFVGIEYGQGWPWGLVLAGALIFLLDRFNLFGAGLVVAGILAFVIKATDLRFTRAWPLLVLAIGAFLLFQTLRDNLRARRRTAADRSGSTNDEADG